MKTLIVGKGIIGTLYGWSLSEAGCDITHLIRPGRGGAFPDGVTLDVLDERNGQPKYRTARYLPHCVEAVSSGDGYELILVPVNAHQTVDVLRQLSPVSGEAVFLLFSGNWEGLRSIDEILPRDRYLLGYPDGGGTIRNGVYWTNLGAELHIGAMPGNSIPRMGRILAVFARAGIHPDPQPNMEHWLWQHAAGAIGFSAGFARYRDVEAFLRDGDLIRACIRATRELYGLCERRGVQLRDYPETSMLFWPEAIILPLLRWNFRHNESMQRYTAHAASDGSLAETRTLFREVSATANAMGVDMPSFQSLEKHLPL